MSPMLALTVAPTADLVTLPEAKAQCRVLHTEEDTLIGAYLLAAREYAEAFCRRVLRPATWTVTLDAFPDGALRLPLSPLGGVESVLYTDANGVEQTLAATSYTVHPDLEPGQIVVVDEWPADATNVRVRFTTEAPEGAKVAVLLLIAHWYANREAVVTGTIVQGLPFSVEALLWPHRLLEFA